MWIILFIVNQELNNALFAVNIIRPTSFDKDKIVIIDYSLGNVESIRNMFNRVGVDACVSGNPDEIRKCGKLILPGVGSFDVAMMQLQKLQLLPTINQLVLEERRPVLGICLGMQLMTKGSEEGNLPGLSWLDARCFKLRPNEPTPMRVPHMGWNIANKKKPGYFFNEDDNLNKFYFAHSYCVKCNDASDVLAETMYGQNFSSAVQRGNIFGVQFHPEKSHRYGSNLMKSFAEWNAT